MRSQRVLRRSRASKYPFDPAAKIEAGPAEIAKLFGPDGAVAKFTNETLTPLIVRRGDTLAAIAKYGIENEVDYISTGGGAFLEILEGKTLPAFEILQKRAAG